MGDSVMNIQICDHRRESKQILVLTNDLMELVVYRYLGRDIVHLVVEYKSEFLAVDSKDQMM